VAIALLDEREDQQLRAPFFDVVRYTSTSHMCDKYIYELQLSRPVIITASPR
jgi:hypothetical protein